MAMAMAKESVPSPNLHGLNHIRKPAHVFPGGRTIALMLTTGLLFVFLLSTHHRRATFYYPPMPTHISPQTTKAGHEDKICNLFNGTWVRDFRGLAYTNITCPTMPESKNCGKYGKQMDYVNWKWEPHGCDMARFEPQLFLNIVRGKTLAFAADSIGRNQMESLLCLLSQVETPTKVYSDTKGIFVTWHFRSHNFTLMALWTKFLVQASEREINGTVVEMHDIHLDKLDARLAANLREINILVISTSRWFFRKNYLYEGGKLIGCIYCSEDNITSFDVTTAIQMALRTALNNLSNCQECGLQLTVVRTATPAHFENGFWNTGGYCNRTEPVGEGEAMTTSTVEWAIRNAQVEEANTAQKKSNYRGQINIEIHYKTLQVEAPSKVHSDTNDKFVTWHFRSHNFTLMALWTKFLVEDSERDINGTASGTHDIHLDKIDPRLAANLHEIDILVISSSQWFIRINYLYEGGKLIGCMFCSEDNITTFSINTGIQRVFRTALNSLRNCQKCRLRLTVVRTTTPTHFENGLWNTGGYCNRTEPVGEGMISEVYQEIRNAQLEEVNRSQKQISHKGQMGIEILDVTKAMSMRPDAHPGIHLNNEWMRSYSDCCHWCLPGPIDMWNELLLSVLKKYGKDLQNQ
ncbi:Protein ALTERED XYLOGLUCAN 4-like [Dichanthelium oligosanthes]|uniref:Protein ALTERED XYLOGLUCAN 4-like n=1 Tax=Dichanthelium oligosanthes TaxID=888268 RepID=A0A1E5VSU6_9POAL|nr:Protein ALTERED XYLOGLUCAN 4-like [Dichanthelium oligosanthes]